MSTGFRISLLTLGIVLLLSIFLALYLMTGASISISAVLYLAGSLLVVAGMVCAPWQPRRSIPLILMGSTLILITATVRMAIPPSGSKLRMVTLPGQSGPRLLNRILDEQDIVLLGAQIAPFLGVVSSQEEKTLVPALSQTYQEMGTQGVTSLSPFLMTYIGQQRTDAFDLLVAEPTSGSTPAGGIIFLHGHGGNFTLQCWLIAKVGVQTGYMTVCPSTNFNGHWWKNQGISILEETIAYLHERGVERIYLAGLSNGGIGATRLADRYKSDLAGLILISGADPGATITELPVLVLHGKQDERIPVALMDQYVHAAGIHATYHLYEGDHFLLLKQAAQVQEVIAEWLIKP